ncbi:hypothetical protein OIU78_006414 [Salix suchowensis]|nr:hypothetical protein OIU78_006414 [Salix suchowensis]
MLTIKHLNFSNILIGHFPHYPFLNDNPFKQPIILSISPLLCLLFLFHQLLQRRFPTFTSNTTFLIFPHLPLLILNFLKNQSRTRTLTCLFPNIIALRGKGKPNLHPAVQFQFLRRPHFTTLHTVIFNSQKLFSLLDLLLDFPLLLLLLG